MPCGDLIGDVGGISSHAMNLLGRNRVEEFEADQVEPGHVLHDTAFMFRLTDVFVDDGEVDPGKPRVETSAPDHVGHLDSNEVAVNCSGGDQGRGVYVHELPNGASETIDAR